MANKIIEGEPIVIVFHVYEGKESHNDTNEVDNFEQWIDFMYV